MQQSHGLLAIATLLVTFSGRISMKPASNIHHVSGHCWTVFQGQRSKVKVITRLYPILAEAYVSTICRWDSFVPTALKYNNEQLCQVKFIIRCKNFWVGCTHWTVFFWAHSHPLPQKVGTANRINKCRTVSMQTCKLRGSAKTWQWRAAIGVPITRNLELGC